VDAAVWTSVDVLIAMVIDLENDAVPLPTAVAMVCCFDMGLHADKSKKIAMITIPFFIKRSLLHHYVGCW
jgi:hypothetical protein